MFATILTYHSLDLKIGEYMHITKTIHIGTKQRANAMTTIDKLFVIFASLLIILILCFWTISENVSLHWIPFFLSVRTLNMEA